MRIGTLTCIRVFVLASLSLFPFSFPFFLPPLVAGGTFYLPLRLTGFFLLSYLFCFQWSYELTLSNTVFEFFPSSIFFLSLCPLLYQRTINHVLGRIWHIHSINQLAFHHSMQISSFTPAVNDAHGHLTCIFFSLILIFFFSSSSSCLFCIYNCASLLLFSSALISLRLASFGCILHPFSPLSPSVMQSLCHEPWNVHRLCGSIHSTLWCNFVSVCMCVCLVLSNFVNALTSIQLRVRWFY